MASNLPSARRGYLTVLFLAIVATLPRCGFDERELQSDARGGGGGEPPEVTAGGGTSAGGAGGGMSEGPGPDLTLDMGGSGGEVGGELNELDCTVGDSECTSATEVRECDVNGKWTEPAACTPACIGERCGGECLPGSTECLSSVQFRSCSGEGVWSEPAECDAACVGKACAGECKPNDTNCISATEVQTCNEQGVWDAVSTCQQACVGKACTGECVPTSTRCPSSTQRQTCNGMGQWETPELCPLACVGTDCGGECKPNAGRCNPLSGVPQRCSDAGAWQDQTACPFVCVGSGTCSGECVPTMRRCNLQTGIPQLCSAAGTYQNQPSCEFVCQGGFCGGECKPDALRCNPISGVPQRCSGTGQWQDQAACGTGSACSSGACVCTRGLSACSGRCVDTGNDANNCGTCGHSCGGGPCSGGVCQPFVLVSSEQFAHDLVVNGSSLYYGSLRPTRENIKRVPKNGGAGQTIVESPTTGNANTFGSVAVNAVSATNNQVFWVANSNPGTTFAQATIVRGRVEGTDTVNFYAPATPPAAIGPLFLSGGFLYWSEAAGTNTTLRRSAVSGNVAVPTTIARADTGVLSGSTFTANCFFYNTTTSLSVLMRACVGGPADLVHTSSTSLFIGRVAADASFVYYFEGSNANRLIQKQPFSGNPAPIGGPAPRGGVIAVDDNFAYYFEQTLSIGAPACTDGFTLFRVPKTGASTPTVLVPPPQNCPTDLIVDSEALYWVNRETGTISKLAK